MCAVDSLQSIAEGNLITNEMDWPRTIVVDTYTEISAFFYYNKLTCKVNKGGCGASSYCYISVLSYVCGTTIFV